MSQEELLKNDENSKSMNDKEEQNNSNLNNDLIEREKKFERINGTNNTNENNEFNLKNKNETADNKNFEITDLTKNSINYKEKNGSGFFISK